MSIAACVALGTAAASAYCRTTTCKEESVQGALCEPESTRQDLPPVPPQCGEAISWRRSCIGFGVQQDAASQLSPETVKELLQDAFTAWEAADCGSAGPSIRVEDLGLVACAIVEYNQDGGNANVLVFREDYWPHEGNQNALALTTVSFDINTAEIYDADIEINSFDRVLTTTQTTGDWDLLSVLTHEAGHALGMAHSTAVDARGEPATMTATVEMGSTTFRSLTDDDVSGICAAYPPTEEPVENCNPIPRHGFSSQCLEDQTYGDCSVARRPLEPAGQPAAGALLLAATMLVARRRKR